MYIVFVLHANFVNGSAISKLEKIIKDSPLRIIWNILYLLVGLMYVAMWMYIISSFLVFITNMYENSDYEMLFDTVFLLVLLYIAYLLLEFETFLKYSK